MPRNPDMPCSVCGGLMWRSKSSSNEPVCRPCRAARRVHGTYAMYDQGKCRCRVCKDAAKARMREYVARRRAEGRPIDFSKRRQTSSVCEQCCVEFQHRVDGSARRFCSLRCANDFQGRRPPRKSAFRRRAERLAARAAVGTSGGKRVFVSGACIVCASGFTGIGASARYCSDRCRARNRNRSFGLSLLEREAIYASDNWCCQICSEPVDATAHPLSDWYPSLDHIVPRSHGGSDDVTNLRTAHRWCNSVRGDLSYYTDADLAA